jgi:hypothetical protein
MFSGGLKERGIDYQFCIHLIAYSRRACSRRGLHRDPLHQQLCVLGGDRGLCHSRGPRTPPVTDPPGKSRRLFRRPWRRRRTQGRLRSNSCPEARSSIDRMPSAGDRIDCFGHNGLLNETSIHPAPARLGKQVPIFVCGLDRRPWAPCAERSFSTINVDATHPAMRRG